jgi:hypothetical protein
MLSPTSAETDSDGLAGSTATADYLTIKPTALGTITVTTKVSLTGAAIDAITISVVASCSNLAFSPATSYFAVRSATNAVTGVAMASSIDDDAALVASGQNGYIRMLLRDAYGSELTAKALIATATGANCLVGLTDAAAATSSYGAGSSSTAVDSDSGYADVVTVAQDDGDIPAICQVSVTYDGKLVGTRTFTFQGVATKVTVSDVTIGTVAASANYGYYRVSVSDAAGNLLPDYVIDASSTETNNAAALLSGVITAVQGNSGAATSSTAGSGYGKTQSVTATNVGTATAGANGLTRFTCSTTKGGVAKVTVRALISAATGTYVTSDPFSIACGGALNTWSISMDKASYSPGEIATLTLTGKDANGLPVSTFTTLSGVVYAFGGMTAVTAPTNGDAFSSGAGIKTYQFSVGTSEGAFVGTFTTTGATDTAAKTVQYTVKSSTATVSNADVLKSIVSLIASINKQIQALQKLILKRR